MELRMTPAHRIKNFWKFKFSKIDDWILYENSGVARSESAQSWRHQ
jgi:hypothetical protein